MPHLIWLSLWGIVVYFAIIVSWFATLFAGQTPLGLHNFIAQYMRYLTQVYGYLLFLADPYQGFVGDRPYPSDLEVNPPAPQNRWITGFPAILAIPAVIVAEVLGYLGERGGDHLLVRVPVHRRDAPRDAEPDSLDRALHHADPWLRGAADRPLPQLLHRPHRVERRGAACAAGAGLRRPAATRAESSSRPGRCTPPPRR